MHIDVVIMLAYVFEQQKCVRIKNIAIYSFSYLVPFYIGLRKSRCTNI